MRRSQNPFLWALTASVLIVALSVAYYLVIYIPKQAEQKRLNEEREAKEQTELEKKKSLEYHGCLARASGQYSINWEGECESQGLKEDCRLPKYNADSLDDTLEKEKDRCLKIYQSK